MNDHPYHTFAIVFARSSFVRTFLFLPLGLLLSSCNVSYHSINPELMKDTRHFSIYEDGLKTLDLAEYVVKDSSGNEHSTFMMSGVRTDSKRVDWNVQFFPNIKLLHEHEHSLEVEITDNRDSTTRTLFSTIHESADGEFSATALGDTVLILDVNGRVGYIVRTDYSRNPLSPGPKFEQYEIELDKVRTTVQHHFEGMTPNDWFALYAGDDCIARIGDMEAKFLGKIVYQIYVKNGVSSALQKDLFFVYLATRAFRSIQDGIVYLQNQKE